MKFGMEILSPSLLPNSNCLPGESNGGGHWTPSENKVFERALAVYDEGTPERWQKVAERIPGKTAGDVLKRYEELEADICNIEAGLVPIPSYDASPFTLELVNSHEIEGLKHGYAPFGKRSSAVRPDLERKKGVPWTEEEHKLFLLGLKKYGKGDWRNISRNFVVSRTPTQVASHAQKYFIRQLSGGKDKRRASIHDITTVDAQNASLETKIPPPRDLSSVRRPSPVAVSAMAFSCAANGDSFADAAPYGIDSFGIQRQSLLHGGAGPPSALGFQLQSSRQHYPCG